MNIEQKSKPMTDFKREKLIAQAARNWDIFYKLNTTKFFKDRHWTDREFEELKAEKGTLLEVGCGVGNLVFPLLETSNLYIHCCDFSRRAIDFVKANDAYDTSKCNAFVCDLTTTDLVMNLEKDSIDFVSCVFVLSAIPPHLQSHAISQLFQVLKPGGKVLFRDYGENDQAQLRFKPDAFINDNFYARGDGTFTYFFSPKGLTDLFTANGFTEIECGPVKKEVLNRKTQVSMDRVFVQGKFMKPLDI